MCHAQNFINNIKGAITKANERHWNSVRNNLKKRDELIDEQYDQFIKEIQEITGWISSLSLEKKNTFYLGLHLFREPSTKEVTMYASLTYDDLATNYYALSFKDTKELALSDFFIYSINTFSQNMKKVNSVQFQILRAFFKGIFIKSIEIISPQFYEINL